MRAAKHIHKIRIKVVRDKQQHDHGGFNNSIGGCRYLDTSKVKQIPYNIIVGVD